MGQPVGQASALVREGGMCHLVRKGKDGKGLRTASSNKFDLALYARGCVLLQAVSTTDTVTHEKWLTAFAVGLYCLSVF